MAVWCCRLVLAICNGLQLWLSGCSSTAVGSWSAQQ
jgi:hypothetical protein